MLCLLALVASSTTALDRGTEAVEQFRVEEAIALLERAESEGPYHHADHVRLYEQLGIALAYAERKEEAIAAFDRMLALAPDHALSYTLSPKATLVFEEARQRAAQREVPAVDLVLPRDRMVDDPLPIDVDVVADPFHFLKRARVLHRVGSSEWRTVELQLDDPSGRHRLVLAPVAPDAQSQVILQTWVLFLDERGNEVMEIGSTDRPREVLLGYRAPEPWYAKWWLWTAIGVAVVAGTTAAIAIGTRSPDPEIEVDVKRVDE